MGNRLNVFSRWIRAELADHWRFHERPSQPIVCSLSRENLRDRFADWAAVAEQALASRKAHESGVKLHYRRLVGVEEELQRLAALESVCCSFLRFEFGESGGHLTLRVSGPPEAIPIIRQCWA